VAGPPNEVRAQSFVVETGVEVDISQRGHPRITAQRTGKEAALPEVAAAGVAAVAALGLAPILFI
jgi:hypothetical protein